LVALNGLEIIGEIRVRRTFPSKDLHKTAQRHRLGSRRGSELPDLLASTSDDERLPLVANPVQKIRKLSRRFGCRDSKAHDPKII
jgi:hypothetical protein